MYVNRDPKKVQVESACPHGAYTAGCGCTPVINGNKITWIVRK